MNRFALCLLLFLASCSPRHFQPAIRDSIYVARVDSVYILDSVYIDRFRTIETKADTVYVTDIKTEYKYRWRDREVHDTTYLDKVVTETVEVPAKLSRWQEIWIRLGKALSVVCALLLALFVIRIK